MFKIAGGVVVVLLTLYTVLILIPELAAKAHQAAMEGDNARLNSLLMVMTPELMIKHCGNPESDREDGLGGRQLTYPTNGAQYISFQFINDNFLLVYRGRLGSTIKRAEYAEKLAYLPCLSAAKQRVSL